jgi:hypothetical protein
VQPVAARRLCCCTPFSTAALNAAYTPVYADYTPNAHEAEPIGKGHASDQ